MKEAKCKIYEIDSGQLGRTLRKGETIVKMMLMEDVIKNRNILLNNLKEEILNITWTETNTSNERIDITQLNYIFDKVFPKTKRGEKNFVNTKIRS